MDSSCLAQFLRRLSSITRTRRLGRTVAIVVVLSVSVERADGQRRPRAGRDPKPQTPSVADGASVAISFPDAVKLSTFIDFVSQSTGIRFVYGDEIKAQTVVFRPGEMEVPRDQLLQMLKSMLRMRDFALVESDIEGWLRIVPADDMQRHVQQITSESIDPDAARSNRVVTQIVHLQSEDVAKVVKHLREFLSSPKATIIEIPERKTLIITDYESAILKAMTIVELIDVAVAEAKIVSIAVEHQDSRSLATRLSQILQDKAKLEERKPRPIVVHTEPGSNSLMVIAPEPEMTAVRELIVRLDVPSELNRDTRAYAPRFISAERLQTLIDRVLGVSSTDASGARLYVDRETNRLYATAPPGIQHQIENLLSREDVKDMEASRPLRIYTPRNRKAAELVSVISEILPAAHGDALGVPNEPSGPPNESAHSVSAAPAGASAVAQTPPGPNRPPNPPAPVNTPPMPPAQEPIPHRAAAVKKTSGQRGEDFVLTHDAHTNSIIAIGPREFHARLEVLLQQLDKRQAQVLIELTLVAITFNDSMGLGIELADIGNAGDYRSILFSSFGLSEIDPTTGMRTPTAGGGFNGILLGPDETPLVMRAIAAHGNSKVIATPKIMVSDNTSATISSVEEAPFTSINASDTVATTSFAGFESAGTTMNVTPHIAEGNHISLAYSFNFSNFTGTGSVGVPPPRTTNSFSGSIEVPDLHTVIVGGLTTENESDSVTEVPLLGRIPVLGALFQSSDRARTKTRIYAFIRPTVLRDDAFADLKFISNGELERAEVVNKDYPESELQWMR